MPDENNYENKQENEHTCNCICQNKDFRKFLVIAGGSFVGVFCALSLFAALHKPPMPAPMPGMMPPRPAMEMQYDGPKHHFDKKRHHHKQFQYNIQESQRTPDK